MMGMILRPLALSTALSLASASAFATPEQSGDLSSFITGQGESAQTVAALPDDDNDMRPGSVAWKRVSRYGEVVNVRKVGISQLTAWTVQKNAHQVVLFATPGAEALFAGVAWNGATGANISDQFMTPPQNILPATAEGPTTAVRPLSTQLQYSPTETSTPQEAAMGGSFTGSIPESMKTVDSLAGLKEGDGAIGDTVYIVIDPRCPYCRQAYNLTRAYVAKGHSIKWIPTAALGNPTDGVPLAATILESKDSDVLGRVMGKHEQIRTKPSPETVEKLSTSLEFLFAAFENNGKQQAGVPVAFFIDHRTGKARMMQGLSEAVVLEDIFGKL